MKDKKLDIARMVHELPNNELKEVKSVRIKPSDLELILRHFGSLQKALDALVKELKG